MVPAGTYQEVWLVVKIDVINSCIGRFNFTVHFKTLLRPLDHPLDVCSLLLRGHALRQLYECFHQGFHQTVIFLKLSLLRFKLVAFNFLFHF